MLQYISHEDSGDETPVLLLILGNYLINILGPAPYCTEVSRNFSIGISGFPTRFALLLTSSVDEMTKYARQVFKNMLQKPKLSPKLCL